MSNADQEPDSTSVRIQRCLNQLAAHDEQALHQLVEEAFRRLVHLTARISRQFPNVREFEDTDAIFSRSFIRLWKALEKVKPRSVREFFGLAARHIRWELLDLARGLPVERRKGCIPLRPGNDEAANAQVNVPANEESPDEFLVWVEMHAKVEQLPGDLAEVFALHYYHGLPFTEIAEVLDIVEKTARNRWRKSLLELRRLLDGCWPKT